MIIVYTKTGCPWGQDVLNFLTKTKLQFEEKEMLSNEANKEECIKKTGQWKCPTLDIDGHFLPDSDAKQLEEYLESLQLIK